MAEIGLQDGRTLTAHDSGGEGFPIVWHHGTPQTGALPAPLVEAAAARGGRVISYGRPSHGGSTPNPGRDVASAARDVAQVADAFGVERFAVIGASGGGPHALACGARLGERVGAVATLEGRWKALGEDAGAAAAAGPEGALDDDLALVSPWGFALDDVAPPVLLAQGGEDRVVPPAHARYMLGRLPDARLRLRSRDGHVSILDEIPDAMDWLRDAAG